MSGMNEQDVFIVSDNVISPLGKTTAANFAKLKEGVSAVKQQNYIALSPLPIFASLFDKDETFIADKNHQYTKFEQLLIASIKDALQNGEIDAGDKKTILIISSTKGNISLLENETVTSELKNRIALSTSAKLVADYFGFTNTPVVISNACISGVLAIITGMRLLQTGEYETAIITGADVISKFIVSGFQSFQALSPGKCKPFDAAHDGLNLGEGAGTIILSIKKKYAQNIKVKGGSVSNDANHISGPSRTGQELAGAISKAIDDANIQPTDIDFISAHGTATVYNDEMEASAIAIAGLQNVPLNSLKGYYGHTLGAAGLIESIITLQSLKQNLFLPTIGFTEAANDKVNICSVPAQIDAKNILKTASGFGGCNAAVVFGK
jgi:3-oxoacyl-[acyl-carrier-protein] synthase-1